MKVLNQAVRRNLDRFPVDFMFRLTMDEADSLRSQFVTLKTGRGQHRKYAPLPHRNRIGPRRIRRIVSAPAFAARAAAREATTTGADRLPSRRRKSMIFETQDVAA